MKPEEKCAKTPRCSAVEAVHHRVQALDFAEQVLALALQLPANLFQRLAVLAELLTGRINAVLDVTDPHEPIPPDWPPLPRESCPATACRPR